MTTNHDMASRTLNLIDLTSLGSDDSTEDVVQLCSAATTEHGNVAAVCVWPRFVGTAVAALEGTGIPVAGVANFPEGDTDIARAVADAREIVDAGGTEVDVVFPWKALRDGKAGVGEELVAATRAAIGPDVSLKVILETGELHDSELIGAAATEAIAGGADFLKTSTGKTERSATPEAVAQLLQIVRAHPESIGVKISGGVRSVDDAGVYIALADEALGREQVTNQRVRIGASSLLRDVLSALETG